jgi:hypothetical protein
MAWMWDITVGADRSDVSGWSSVAVLMGERLEVHGLGWVHLFAESEQVEGGVGTNFVFHALKNTVKR